MDQDRVSVKESAPLLEDAPSGNRSPDDEHSTSSGGEHSIYDSSRSEIDEDELQYDLARVNSHPNGLGMEPNSQETMPLARSKTYGTVCSQEPTFHQPGLEEEVDGQSALNDANPAGTDSKFLGVSRGRFWLVFGGILFAYFVACFDSTLMASSHPVITSYFHSSNSASWLSTVFLLTSTAFQPLFGRVSDTVGRRPLYLFALITFALTTAWCATAQSIGSFIAARAVCGLGAGGTMSMGMIITSDLVPIEHRGIYQSYINLSFGLGSALGAALGGFLCDRLGWRWTFGIQVPYILVCLLTAWITTPGTLGPNLAKQSNKGVWETIKGFDLLGSFLLTTSVTFLILGLNLGGNVLSWGHPVVIISILLFCVTAGLLIRVESRAARPVMPLKLLSSQPRANLIFANFFGNIAGNTIIFNVPLYFQAVKLDSATNSGFRLAAPSLAIMVSGVSTGFIITWTRRLKPTLFLGSVLYLIGSVCMASLWPNIPDWLSVIFLTPAGLGQGFAFPSTVMCVLALSSQEDQAVVTTTLVLWRSIGTVMGVAVSSLILQNALFMYLNKMVTGKHKVEIIHQVRKSVHAIVDLDPRHQAQVIDAYSAALRITFASAVVASVVLLLIILPIKLPRLGKKR
ncbi:MAG: hypothetical protein M1830_009507 [Pleopsidium flavum]|nr:MAG: hypothetical protein M1830_009507 [Pleopsidium flavum]